MRTASEVSTETGETPALFQHSKRAQWGLAILAWEGPTARRYQFQDGQLRTFKKGYYHLLPEVDRPVEEAEEVATELLQRLDLSRARQERKVEATRKGRKLLTLDDQFVTFTELFPEGFVDPKWISEIRGEGASRALKRHRHPAIGLAKEALAMEAIDTAIAEGRFEDVHSAVKSVLASTDLSRPSRDLPVLDGIEDGELPEFATALRAVLYEEGTPYSQRFTAWVKALGVAEAPGWELATVLPALVHCDTHVAVLPSAFQSQARWMAPRLKLGKAPTASHYNRLRTMALSVRKGLIERTDSPPRDLVDVRDFIWQTLRPGARKKDVAPVVPAPQDD